VEEHRLPAAPASDTCIRQHTSAYVSIREHTSICSIDCLLVLLLLLLLHYFPGHSDLRRAPHTRAHSSLRAASVSGGARRSQRVVLRVLRVLLHVLLLRLLVGG